MSNGDLKSNGYLNNITEDEPLKLKELEETDKERRKRERRERRETKRAQSPLSDENEEIIKEGKEGRKVKRNVSFPITSEQEDSFDTLVKSPKSDEEILEDNRIVDDALHFMKSSVPRPKEKDDLPKVDAGVRMLCMDGGGAKGAIEATVIDKIFVTVAVTLKYPYHVINWLTLMTDKNVKLEEIKAKILDIVDEKNKFKSVEIIKGCNLLDKKCYIIAGMINKEDLSSWLTFDHKKKIMDAYHADHWDNCVLRDFLHGATKYWMRYQCGSDSEREILKSRIGKVFSNNRKAKAHSFLIPSHHITGKRNEDLLVFYWDKPTKTKLCNKVKEFLLTLEHESIPIKGELFIDEVYAHEIFDLLIGTSTGSILAFGMGYLGLSPQECRDIYLKCIKDIFCLEYDNTVMARVGLNGTVLRTVGDLLGQGHYDIAGVVSTLKNHFNGMKMGGGNLRKDCICACVALNWETQASEVFDTHNKKLSDWDLIPFLAASSDAPVYFNTPYLIKGPNEEKGTNYVDGGLGANCPAKKGIELAKERWPEKAIELVLAIGAGKAPNVVLPENGGAWLKTFVTFATDGDKVWENQVLPTLATDDACENAAHHRIQPIISEISSFAADSTAVLDMCICAENWLNTSIAFDQILEAAGKIISKSMTIEVESRILTEADLLRWVASETPFMKGKCNEDKDINYYGTDGESRLEITNDALDMKFGREIHGVRVDVCEKLRNRMPCILQRFTYRQKQESVSNSDMLFTIRFDHNKTGNLRDQKILNLHCPDNHEARLVGYIQLFDYTMVYPLACANTVPDADSKQFHRIVHEASKEISQLREDSLLNAEQKLCNAFELTPEECDRVAKANQSNFLRIQGYFYLWKSKNPSADLTSLNKKLIKVGMKKISWPVLNARLGHTDVTIRTILPASSQTILFEVSYDYFTSKLKEAKAKQDDHGIKRYSDFLRLLNYNPLSKHNKQIFQRKNLSDFFKSRKLPGHGRRQTKIVPTDRRDTADSGINRNLLEKWKKRPQVKKKVVRVALHKGTHQEPPHTTSSSLLKKSIFTSRTKKHVQIVLPERLKNSPYGHGLDIVSEVPSREPSVSPKRGRRMGAFC